MIASHVAPWLARRLEISTDRWWLMLTCTTVNLSCVVCSVSVVFVRYCGVNTVCCLGLTNVVVVAVGWCGNSRTPFFLVSEHCTCFFRHFHLYWKRNLGDQSFMPVAHLPFSSSLCFSEINKKIYSGFSTSDFELKCTMLCVADIFPHKQEKEHC